MADIIAETERLVLRTPDKSDILAFDLYLNTPSMRTFLGGPEELHDIERKHAQNVASFAREGYGFLSMIEKQGGEYVGQCGLKRVDAKGARNPGDFEIGWMVREDRWRRGYAREAVDAVLEWAFDRLHAPHVVAFTSERNEPSWRMMERIGMGRRADLDFVDPDYPPGENPTIVYALTRDQWEKCQ